MLFSKTEGEEIEPVAPSMDVDPRDRSIDRALAAMGCSRCGTWFAPGANVAQAGVLLAIPALIASGLLPIARRLYGSLAPAFYGLRTTLVVYVLLALLRIPRPENLKEHVPGDLGRIVGLDRCWKSKRCGVNDSLGHHRAGARLGRELAQRRIAERGKIMGFLYIDGHLRVYHGKHTIAKGYSTRQRLAVPATSDYWVNDQAGDPLFVVTAEANAAMTQMLEPLLKEARGLLGEKRRATWSLTAAAGARSCS